MKISTGLVLGGALLLSPLGVRSTWAQGVVAPNAALQGVAVPQPYKLPVHNGPAFFVATWLSPQNHDRPWGSDPVIPGEARVAQGTRDPKAPWITLPAGVERVVADPASRGLLVYGTAEGVEKLRPIVEMLDKSLLHVEVRTRYVRVAPADLAALGLLPATATQFDLARSTPGIQVSFAPSDFEATLQTLQKSGRAQVAGMTGSAVPNGSRAELRTSGFTVTPLDTRKEGGPSKPAVGDNNTVLQRMEDFVQRATINSDDTLTVEFLSFQGLESQTKGQKPVALQTSNPLYTVLNIHDGETVAISGFDSRFTNRLQPAANKPPSILLLLVSPRIVETSSQKIK